MTDIELERIDALLKASGLAGKTLIAEHFDRHDQYEGSPTQDIIIAIDDRRVSTGIADCDTSAIAEFYAAAPAAVGALLAEIARMNTNARARRILDENEFDN